MKLLHTGDWHLGKRLFGIERMDEAEAALAEVAEAAEREAVDAVVVSGDLLDRRLIDPAALGACLRAMERLARTAPVLAVAGNHDDPDLWIHLAPHLAASGIHVAGRVRPPADAVVTVETASGPLHVGLLPWPEPARMSIDAGASAGDARVRDADRVASVIAEYAQELTARRRREGGAAVLLAHVMVANARPGGGEREMTMGITYVVSSAALPVDLDYIALGHVHRPQSIPGLAAAGRYAGSPMALDFSDEGLAPSACLVEISGDRTTHRLLPLTSSRPLVRLHGPLDRLAGRAAAHPGAWFACEVELEAPVMDLVRRVRDEVPDALRVEPRYPEADEPAPGPGEAGGDPAAGLGDLYAEWHRASGRPLTAARAAAFAEAVAAGGAGDDADEG